MAHWLENSEEQFKIIGTDVDPNSSSGYTSASTLAIITAALQSTTTQSPLSTVQTSFAPSHYYNLSPSSTPPQTAPLHGAESWRTILRRRMAPTRRLRGGANKETTTSAELRIGDLVLAKVLGFPAWPAKVSRPEEWGRAPDPRKIFVRFFGTQETGFVAAADTHPFSRESKGKLLTECQGKAVRHFARAVKEICEAFEELQERKSDVLGNDGDQKITDINVKEEICSDDKRYESVSSGDLHAKVAKSRESKDLGIGSKRKFKVSAEQIEDHDTTRDRKGAKLRKIVSDNGARGSFPDAEKIKSLQGKSAKSLSSGREKVGASSGSLKDVVGNSKWHADSDQSGQKNGRQPGHENHVSSANGISISDKKTKDVGTATDVSKVAVVQNVSNPSDKRLDTKADLANPEPDLVIKSTETNEGDLPVSKRRQDLGLMSDPSDHQKGLSYRPHKADARRKRRAIRLFDEDDDKPKTPVHGRSDFKGLAKTSGESTEQILSFKSLSITSSHAPLPQASDISEKAFSSRVSGELEFGILLNNHTESALITAKKSSLVNAIGNKFVKGQGDKVHRVSPQRSSEVVVQKAIKNPSKVSGTVVQGKAQQVSDKASAMGTPHISSQITKTEASMKGISSSLDENLSSPKSIKQLIAAAKNAQMQNISHGNPGSFSTPSVKNQDTSLNPPSTGNPVLLETQTPMQLDLQVPKNKAAFVSPASHNQLTSQNQHDNGAHKDRVGSGHEAGGVSLSGGTDAAINRDAFEGMIETLSRTKESIGRATRLAINCAKSGIASEVVDLLIRRLENEPNNRRRVDLFFLLDSITQCSHSQKGIAGAPYIPAVQAVLPRLFSAVVPPGIGARENRRQCLKVLRLWLERKIFPESVLRRFMDDIEATGGDTKSVYSSRRPSRSERGVDDLLREIGTIQFDEYGSNASFQLDGIFGIHRFNDDEENEGDRVSSCTQTADASPVSSCIQAANASPLDRPLPELGTGSASPMDDHHRSLEDVNGELETEDIPRNQNDESKSENDLDEAASPKGSPPLPLESPPAVPPLPSSPPPLSGLLPTLPPPPPTSALSPPLHSQLHPSFISPPSSMQPGQYPTPVPPLGPQSLFSFQGSQPVQATHNTLQQSPSFRPAGVAIQRESLNPSRSLQHRHKHKDVFSSQTTELKQQLHHAGQAAFAKTPNHPARHSQTPQSLNPYNKPIQQISLHQHPRPYSSSSLPNARIPFFAQKRWSASSAGYRRDGRNRNLMNGGRTQTGSFRPPAHRLSSSNMGFQYSSPNPSRIAGPAAGQNHGHFFPSIVNRWRPVAWRFRPKKSCEASGHLLLMISRKR
ncbi:HUA2-LIKE 1-like protein [Drosera capensis]